MMIRTVLIVLLTMVSLLPLSAQNNDGWHASKTVKKSRSNDFAYMPSDVGAPKMLHLRTNLLYDALLVPSVGAELSLGRSWSFLADGSFNWLKFDSKHWYWRVATATVEARLWTGGSVAAMRHRGHHFGIYAGCYRYDFEFGSKGYMANFNYGGGVSYGYSMPIARRLSLDLGLSVGYIGGNYKEYDPIDTHYVLQREKRLNWIGPTKLEVTLVWSLELKKKGGQQW